MTEQLLEPLQYELLDKAIEERNKAFNSNNKEDWAMLDARVKAIYWIIDELKKR
jgi:hypothetical protein